MRPRIKENCPTRRGDILALAAPHSQSATVASRRIGVLRGRGRQIADDLPARTRSDGQAAKDPRRYRPASGLPPDVKSGVVRIWRSVRLPGTDARPRIERRGTGATNRLALRSVGAWACGSRGVQRLCGRRRRPRPHRRGGWLLRRRRGRGGRRRCGGLLRH
jgi:hypothetical protein